MLAVGLQGSPRKGGNNNHTLGLFLNRLKHRGFQTETLPIPQLKFAFCIGCGSCEKSGWCIFEDDYALKIAPLLRRAEVIVMASPVYFYGPSGQLKSAMDRGQMFWSRKYRLKLSDPGKKRRRGYILSSAATHGDDLFTAFVLNSRYFFDAIDATYAGALTFRGAEGKGALAERSDTEKRVYAAADLAAGPLFPPKHHLLFVCKDGAVKSRIAWAVAMSLSPSTTWVSHAGTEPAPQLKARCDAWMERRKTDIRYIPVFALQETLDTFSPSLIVDMDGSLNNNPTITADITWDLPSAPPENDDEAMALIRQVETRVRKLLPTL
ncbi:flavodoxin family protein [Desulfoluna butyratoxydans]|uniref:Nadph-dependent fmn reductase-like n=1 Tax=Desulfoluna butyratoxydans TaxID=231438 RepID=A0A4U8YHZ4_9BACT|nr:flavodoxin family protein [Desulfoluna butyratoxydans]VFQ42877.1 nadph-dependent fmn reductase-like [Desulfoluna butyratoxydans]